MPQVTSQNEHFAIHGGGPVAQCYPTVTQAPFPVLDVAGGAAPKWTSDLILADGFRSIAAGVTLSRNGTIKIIRYVDLAGQVLLKTDTLVLTAATAAAITVTDNLPFGSFKVEIENTDNVGGHTAAITNFSLLLNGG